MYVQAKAVTYEQEVYNQFTYKKDRPYFHSFPGDVSDLCCQQLLGASVAVGTSQCYIPHVYN